MATMTSREFYTKVIEANVTEELTEYAQDAIKKLDTRNEKRSSKPSKKAEENAPIKESIRTYLAEHPKALATEIATALEITTSKASSLARQLVTEGVAISEDVKVKGKGSQKAYSLA